MAQNRRRRRRLPLKLNVGVVIFGFIFIYLAINVILYFTRARLTYYEVTEGSVADETDRSYTAVALRDENVCYADSAGYVNYYARENSRVSKNTTLYSIDKNGRINELLSQMSDEDKTLSDDNVRTIKEQLYAFTSGFDEMNFDEVYDFKNSLQGTVAEFINMNALKSIGKSVDGGQFEIRTAQSSGIVEYYVDNYEDLTPQKLTASLFDKKNYTSAKFKSGDIIEAGSPVYKTISQEEWKLAIQLSDKDAAKYNDASSLKVRFKKDGTGANADFRIIKGTDSHSYGILTLEKYMMRYGNERFLDIEIVDEQQRGLKVPKKSIVNKDFYVIPAGYKTTGGDSDSSGFIRRFYEKSEIRDVFSTVQIPYETDDYCYVAKEDFSEGDEILLPSSISKKAENKKDSETSSNSNDSSAAQNNGADDGDSSEGRTDDAGSDNSSAGKDNESDSSDKDGNTSGSSDGSGEENNSDKSDSETDDDSQENLPATYVIGDTQSLTGVYNINSGYAEFVFVNILDETGDYYIIESRSRYGLMMYDHIILNGDKVKENQIIFQ